MIRELRWVLEHPPAAGRGLNRLYHTRFGLRSGYSSGEPLFGLDWDICVIFDACRYDMYHDLANDIEIAGNIEKRLSVGSSTTEWLKQNFSNGTHTDTVYVTGNPQYHMHRDELWPTFHDTLHIWKDGWDDDLQTVPPSAMNNALLDAADEYPNKRLLAHYVQPHVPFIGDFGRETFPITISDTDGAEWNAARNFWPSIRRGERDHTCDDLLEAYQENLQLAIESVVPTLKSVEGKAIITSDHGQLLGERIWPIPIKEYAHPAGLYVPELVETPLHILPCDSRRTIKTGTVESENEVADGVEKRLNALGYQ